MYQEFQSKKRQHSWNSPTSKWNCKHNQHTAVRTEHRYAAFVRKMNEENEKCEKYWNSILPILHSLQDELLSLGKPPYYKQTVDNIKYCVNLFRIASTAQDALEGSIKICPADKHNAVKAFNNDLFYCGRHTAEESREDTYHGKVPYWNTSKVGEMVTMETICFGPEIGLPRKPAIWWCKLSKSKKVYIEEQTQYQKGILRKELTTWATDALVKTGINHFISDAYKALTTELEALLENE